MTAATLQVITHVTPSIDNSPELRLSLKMFRKELPEGARLQVLQGELDESGAQFKAALQALLDSTDPPAVVLLARSPWFFVGPDAMRELQRIMDAHSDIDCLVASDTRDYRADGPAAIYLTLRGFQRFVAALQDPSEPLGAYDGRAPLLFMVRTAALQGSQVPDDVFSIPQQLRARTRSALNAYVHNSVDYYGENREEMVAYIPDDAGAVLDIGCSRGGFGAVLKAQRGCRVVGLELNAYEGDNARARLDRVVTGDALAVDIGERFDCVTCLDSLEHFTDPDRLLARIRDEFLKPGGALVISLPNVGHWSIVEDLLAGRWDYVPSGLLCNTHYRFYTLPTINELLGDYGFAIEQHGTYSVPVPVSLEPALRAAERGGASIDWDSLPVVNHHIRARMI